MKLAVELDGMPAFVYLAKDERGPDGQVLCANVYAPVDGKLCRPTKRFVCEAEGAAEAQALFCKVLGVVAAEGKFKVGPAVKGGDVPREGEPEMVRVSEVRAYVEGAQQRVLEVEAVRAQAEATAIAAEARASAAEKRVAELEGRVAELAAELVKKPPSAEPVEAKPAEEPKKPHGDPKKHKHKE